MTTGKSPETGGNEIVLTGFEDMIEACERARAALLESRRRKTTELPLRFLRQSAHLTSPASSYKMLSKAAAALDGIEESLAKVGITLEHLASILGVEKAELDRVLAENRAAPLAMVDGEDAQALSEEVLRSGRLNAVRAFLELDWRGALAFYRPSGLSLDYSVQDLVTVFSQVAHRFQGPKTAFPIQGIVWPKVEHMDEVRWVSDLLGELEHRIGLAENQVKLELLIESGWGCLNLPAIVEAAAPRLAGLIFGIADFSADVGLGRIENDNPVCDWARAMIVAAAGAAGVPALDSMTLNYPVRSKDLDDTRNRIRILDALKETYRDAVHGIERGMTGKWVGHPLQLFVVLAAVRGALSEQTVRNDLAEVEAYEQARRQGMGATVIGGKMTDRATDRHVRDRLRKAIALGRLDRDTGLRLGLIDGGEYDQLA